MVARTPKMSVSPGCLYLVLGILLQLLVNTAGSAYPKEYICDNDFTKYTYNDCHKEWSDMGCYRQEHTGGIGSCAPLCNTIHSLRGEGKCRHQCSRYFSTCTLAIATTTIRDANANSSDLNTGTSETYQLQIILGSVFGIAAVVALLVLAVVCCCKKKAKQKETTPVRRDDIPLLDLHDSPPTQEEVGPDSNENPQDGANVAGTSDSTGRLCTETNDRESMPNDENTGPDNPSNPSNPNTQQPTANLPDGDQPDANPSASEHSVSNPTVPDQLWTNADPDANPESSEPSVPARHGIDDSDLVLPNSQSTSRLPSASFLDDGYCTGDSPQSAASDASSVGSNMTDAEGNGCSKTSGATRHNVEENRASGSKAFVETTLQVEGVGKDTTLKLEPDLTRVLGRQQGLEGTNQGNS